MMNRRLIWCGLCSIGFVFGCRSAAKMDTAMIDTAELGSDVSSEQTSPVIPASATSTWNPTTFVDMPELQEGTGKMDSGPTPEFTTTDSGLKYRILRKSNGRKPTAANTVSVNYRGWRNRGKVFDSSYERGKPTTFPLQNVIAGWTEGMQLVGEGGMIELWVPSNLGYGERGSPGSIPPHSNLHFIVELVDVQ